MVNEMENTDDLTNIQMDVLSDIKGHLESNPLRINVNSFVEDGPFPPIFSLAGNGRVNGDVEGEKNGEGEQAYYEWAEVVKTEELFRLFNKYCNVLLELEGEYFLKVLEIYKKDIAMAELSEDVLYSELRDEVVVEWYWIV